MRKLLEVGGRGFAFCTIDITNINIYFHYALSLAKVAEFRVAMLCPGGWPGGGVWAGRVKCPWHPQYGTKYHGRCAGPYIVFTGEV